MAWCKAKHYSDKQHKCRMWGHWHVGCKCWHAVTYSIGESHISIGLAGWIQIDVFTLPTFIISTFALQEYKSEDSTSIDRRQSKGVKMKNSCTKLGRGNLLLRWALNQRTLGSKARYSTTSLWKLGITLCIRLILLHEAGLR